MPQPTRSQVHVNRPLSNMSVAYSADIEKTFIAEQVFPTVPVEKQSDTYYVYPKDNWFRDQSKERAPADESVGTGFGLTTDSYGCKLYALHSDVADQIRANADTPLDLDRDAMKLVMRQLMLGKEINWASKFFTTSVWTGSSTAGDITPGTLWSASNATPIVDITAQQEAMEEKTGYWANTLVLSRPVWNKIKNSADFLARVNGGATNADPAQVNPQLLAQILELDRVLIAGAVKNTAKEGATATLARVFGKHALLCYTQPSPGIMQASAGYTFAWTEYATKGAKISRFRIEQRKCDRVEGEISYDQKVVAADLGVFFASCIA